MVYIKSRLPRIIFLSLVYVFLSLNILFLSLSVSDLISFHNFLHIVLFHCYDRMSHILLQKFPNPVRIGMYGMDNDFRAGNIIINQIPAGIKPGLSLVSHLPN